MDKQTYDQLIAIRKYRKPTTSKNVPDKLVQIVKKIVEQETDIEWGEIVCCYQWGLTASKDEIWCDFVYKSYNSARTHKVYDIVFYLNNVQDDYEITDNERYDYITEMYNLTDEE